MINGGRSKPGEQAKGVGFIVYIVYKTGFSIVNYFKKMLQKQNKTRKKGKEKRFKFYAT